MQRCLRPQLCSCIQLNVRCAGMASGAQELTTGTLAAHYRPAGQRHGTHRHAASGPPHPGTAPSRRAARACMCGQRGSLRGVAGRWGQLDGGWACKGKGVRRQRVHGIQCHPVLPAHAAPLDPVVRFTLGCSSRRPPTCEQVVALRAHLPLLKPRADAQRLGAQVVHRGLDLAARGLRHTLQVLLRHLQNHTKACDHQFCCSESQRGQASVRCCFRHTLQVTPARGVGGWFARTQAASGIH